MFITLLFYRFMSRFALGNVFLRHFKEDYLWGAIKILILSILIIVLITYIRLYRKKKKYLYKTQIRKKLESWISGGVLDMTPDELKKTPIPKNISANLNLRVRRQYLVNELVDIRRSFSGELGANLSIIYERLGLKDISVKKLKSDKWFHRARGIQELYIMEQRDTLDQIYEAANDDNEYVRMEAQTGIIHMQGYDGLKFLDEADYYLTEWQQLKILQQLDDYERTPALHKGITNWLKSENDSVVLFGLRLTDHYGLKDEHDNVVKCLEHPNENIREQAVTTLSHIPNDRTADLLVKRFPNEKLHGQLNILDALELVATERQEAFLSGLLSDESGLVRLKAARVLAVCCPGGLSALEARATKEPDRYKGIYLHAKKQLAK